MGPSMAQASSNQDVFFEAPRDLTAAASTDASRDAAFAELTRLGVKALRVNLRWYDVAPEPESSTKPAFDATSPSAYNWGNYGATIDRAKALGWKVVISPSSSVPKWATAAGVDTVTRPKADEFKLFTQAAALRFGGANVLWSIWNEPNLPKYLQPQIQAGKPVGPALYRELFLAGRDGIRAGGQPTAPVLFGETSNGGSSTDGRLAPLAFLRAAFCLSSKYKFDASCGKLTLDGVAHHPYQFTLGAPKSDDVTYQVISRLPTFLDKAAKAGAVNSGLQVYLTEFGVQSQPDAYFGLPPQQQLELRARVERDAYYNKRVRGFSQYLLTDDNSGTGPNNCVSFGGFETGLRYADGRAKPSLAGFGLVLDVKPSGKKSSIWGLVRRATGPTNVVIERRVSGKGSFKRWKTVKTKSNGAFTATDTLHSKGQYRYRWTSPEGKVTSPAVNVFKGWQTLKIPKIKPGVRIC
ncbi:MAG: hypothetical protein JHD16_08610 [Solirubrobacteraceae bacterium]|nr:hypothetical protein [Solirubrobacteraceae bacterium]